MSWRDLKYKSIALSVDDSLELLDDFSMKFVEFVLRENLPDELPQDNLLPVLKPVGFLLLDALNQVLPGGGSLEVVFSKFASHYSSRGMSYTSSSISVT